MTKKFLTDKIYQFFFIGFSFGYGTFYTQSSIIGEIYAVFGYDQGIVVILIGSCFLISFILAILYVKFCMKNPNQLIVIERMLIVSVIFYCFGFFYMYFCLPQYGAVSFQVVFITIGIAHVPILTEEIIKYCSVAFPGNTVYATGLLMIGFSAVGTGLSAGIGLFFDTKVDKREWTVVAGLLMSTFFLIYVVFISLAETALRKSDDIYNKLSIMRTLVK